MREILVNIADNLFTELLKEAEIFFNLYPDKISDSAKIAFTIIRSEINKEKYTPDEEAVIFAFMDELGTGFKTADSPLDYVVLSICCYICENYELSAMFSAVGFLRTHNVLAFIFMSYSLIRMAAIETPAKYISLIESATPEVPARLNEYYKRLARNHFYHGDMEASDHYLQRMMAVKHYRRKQIKNIDDCRIDNVDWDKFDVNKHRNFTPETEEQAERNYKKWTHHSNKHQISCITAELIYRMSLKSCLELGSHAGALLSIIGDLCKGWKYEVSLIGIEPDLAPFELSKEKLPGCEFHLGDHNLLGKFGDRKFGILLCSYICVLNREEIVDIILEFASRSCEYLVLADDFSNATGDRPVIRRHYVLHNWDRLLAKHGLRITDRIFLEDANEAANGILIAKSGH